LITSNMAVRILTVASFNCKKIIVKIVVFRAFNSYLLWDQVLVVLYFHSHKNKIHDIQLAVHILIVASFCNKIVVKIVVFRAFNSYLLWDQLLVLF
jgi:hypothetical protein